MAKNNNLTDFLTDVANAIREKKGSSDPINPQNFSDEIASIETGGGGGASVVTEGDVNFRDYDGTILHSYSKNEFLALSELPELPTQKGLICQGWNYSLEDAQSYVEEYGVIEVGAMYITDDGKTRLYINIAERGRMTLPFYFSQTVANGVTINWGDGSPLQTVDGTGGVNTTHTYEEKGDYIITLDVVDGCALQLNSGTTSACVFGPIAKSNKAYLGMLQRVEIGKNVTSTGAYSFNGCYSLKTITIPYGVTSIDNYQFYECSSLKSIVIPNSVTSIVSRVFYSCYSLEFVVIPNSVKTIAGSTFMYCSALKSVVIPDSITSLTNDLFKSCRSLKSVVVPDSVTSTDSDVFYGCSCLSSIVVSSGMSRISNNTFQDCVSLRSVVLPDSVKYINMNVFYQCYSLVSIVMPSKLTSIGSKAFYYCFSMKCYDFRNLTSIPTLSEAAISVFQSSPSDCQFVVPDALYDDWIAATNWSGIASKIIKASEYTD